MAHPTYQRALAAWRLRKRSEDSAVHPSHYHGSLSRKPRVIRRAFSEAARLSQALSRGHSRTRMAASVGHDILWRAKRNAFRQALSQHRVTEAGACRILCLLVAGGARGRELACLGDPTGLGAPVPDRALPLMGLHNMITIEERPVGAGRHPGVSVVATEHGRRFAREAASLLAPAPQAPPITAPGTCDGAGA